MLSFNRQAFLVDAKYKFWGGIVMNIIGEFSTCRSPKVYTKPLSRSGQGKELFQWHLDLARKSGVTPISTWHCPNQPFLAPGNCHG